MESASSPVDPHAELRAELARLKAKRDEIKDADVVAALNLRIAQIEQELPVPEAQPDAESEGAAAKEEEEEPLPPEPTPEQAAEAERLIRQAKVEKMRNNAQASTELLRKAAEVAPGSPVVLEALGDDLAERKRLGEALRAYAQALRISPKNVGLERKHAHAVFQIQAAGSIDDQMRRNLSDSPLILEEDRLASLPTAMVLTVIFPGLGHLVLGQTQRGLWLLGAWALAFVWLLTMWGDFAKLFAFGVGGNVQPNLTVMLPLVIMTTVLVAALASLKNLGTGGGGRKPPSHPKPPVDLPFE